MQNQHKVQAVLPVARCQRACFELDFKLKRLEVLSSCLFTLAIPASQSSAMAAQPKDIHLSIAKIKVSFLQGFDKRFSDKLGWTLRDSNAGGAHESDQFRYGNHAAQKGSFGSFSLKGQNLEGTSASTASQKDAYKILAAHSTNFFSVSDSSNLQIGTEPSDVSTKSSSLNKKSFSNVESENTLGFESSSPWNEVEALRMGRIENHSKSSTGKSELHLRSNPSPVVIKKPVTVSRPSNAPNNKFEGEMIGNTDSFSTNSDSDEEGLASNVVGFHMQRKDLRHLDLTTGLKALRRLISGKKTEAAKDLAKQLYEQYAGDTDVLVEYAYVEKQRGDLVAAGALYSQAITAFEAQKNLGYDYVRALQALGSIEAHARNAKRARVLFMESIRAARQAERRFPDMINGAAVYGLHAWARLEEQLGNWSKAQELLARAAEIQPGNAVVHQSRALLEARAHNWGAARYHFRLAVKAAPNDVKCWHAWAIFEGSQGKRQKMRQLFQRALEVDPTSVHSLQAWAYQEMLVGTPESKEKAQSLYHRCTQIEPENLYSWQAWAVMEHTSGNYDKARELFEKCLGVNSSSVACLQAFANMERSLGNLGAAQMLLRKALRVEPENAAVLMEAAFVEEGLGNAELAEKLFILAGMADKRKSRVRNEMFLSRKASMPITRRRRMIADRNKKFKDRVAVKQPSSCFKQEGKARSQQRWTPGVLGS